MQILNFKKPRLEKEQDPHLPFPLKQKKLTFQKRKIKLSKFFPDLMK